MQAWLDQLYATFIEKNYYIYLIEGFKNTIIMTVGALIIGVLIGTVIAIVKYFSGGGRFDPASALCDLYITVIRGIPMVVQLLIFYYVIMKSTKNGVLVGVVAFGINSGAYMAELIRSGINAVDPGQDEAGRSLGLSRLDTMRYVILPQAVKNILPAIGNEMIALLKETSVAGYVAVIDLARGGNLIRNNTYDAANPLIAVALIYLLMVILLTNILSRFEQKLSSASKR